MDTLAELFDAVSQLRAAVEAESQQIKAEWGLPIERDASGLARATSLTISPCVVAI